ncbi:MAG: redoxin domain-containing protein [Verrucomicrobiota bacterium]
MKISLLILLFAGTFELGCKAIAAETDKLPLHVSSLEGLVLKTSTYQDYKIGRALIRRKAVLLTFPGTWDPYSIHALKVMRNVEVELADMDVQIIAVTTDTPLKIKELLDEHNIPFVVASDLENRVAQSLGLVETLDEARLEQLKTTRAVIPEHGTLALLNILFFRADGELESRWAPTQDGALITQEEVREMAAHLHMPPALDL